ncbi:hypothetical protein D3C73_1625850 [compost metagenome]
MYAFTIVLVNEIPHCNFTHVLNTDNFLTSFFLLVQVFVYRYHKAIALTIDIKHIVSANMRISW